MIHVYSGNEEFLKNNYLHVYKCCYDLGLKSPTELLEFAQGLLQKSIENPNATFDVVSNHPDFIMAVGKGFALHGLPYQFWLNGEKSDLNSVMHFINTAFSKLDNWLDSVRSKTPITAQLLEHNGFVVDSEHPECMIKEGKFYLLSWNTENKHAYLAYKKQVYCNEIENLLDFQKAIDGIGLDLEIHL